MFSGIIKSVGTVVALERHDDIYRIKVDAPLFSQGARRFVVGDSIAISGVCLTVLSPEGVELRPPFAFDIGTETVRRTNLAALDVGRRVNIEPSLCLGDSLDGHLVQGHVDCVAEVRAIAREGNTFRVELSLPAEIRALVAKKGAVTIDGVSLTVGEVEVDHFAVYVVPHTWQETTMQFYQVGTLVNLEADMIARYLERLLAVGRDQP